MENNIITTLFENMANRFNTENNLSDITYSFLVTDEVFRYQFLGILFPDDTFGEDIVIQREVVCNSGRPDFVITTPEKNFLIEVKKGNRQHHFSQYMSGDLKNYTRAYITNYEITASYKSKFQSAYNFLTWKEIYTQLLNATIKSPVIDYYLAFLKESCVIKEINDMRFDNLEGLYNFNLFVDELISSTTINNKELLKSTKHGFDNRSSGKYFTLGNYLLWFGVCYDNNDTNLDFSIKFPNKPTNRKMIEKLSKTFKNNYPWDDGTGIDCCLDDETFKKLQNEENIEIQKKIISDFFTKVLSTLDNYSSVQ